MKRKRDLDEFNKLTPLKHWWTTRNDYLKADKRPPQAMAIDNARIDGVVSLVRRYSHHRTFVWRRS